MNTEENPLAETENQQSVEESDQSEESQVTEQEIAQEGDQPDQSATENADNEQPEQEPTRKKGAKERREQLQSEIHELVKRRKAAEKKALQAEEQLKAYQEQEIEVKPDYEYDDQGDYVRDVAKQVALETRRQTVQEAAQAAQEEAKLARQQAFDSRVAEARQTTPDIDQAIEVVGRSISDGVASMIMESDNSVEIVNFLHKNPLEVQKLQSANPVQVARQIGQLEARLSRPATKKVSTAPKPVPTVSGGSAANEKDYGGMSYSEYRKARGFD